MARQERLPENGLLQFYVGMDDPRDEVEHIVAFNPQPGTELTGSPIPDVNSMRDNSSHPDAYLPPHRVEPAAMISLPGHTSNTLHELRTPLEELLDAFASVCTWTTVYYRWRPNLQDEADDHLFELAVAAGAEAIVTKNVRHLRSGDLRFEQIQILKPEQILKEL